MPSNMNYHYSIKYIIVLLSITLHVLPPIQAFGYAKCFLTFKNIEYANCIDQGVVNLRESIQHLPNQTLWLNVSLNHITVLEDKVFSHLSKLLELRLNRNQISTIHSGAFYNLYSLYFLDLSNNLLQSLQNVDTKDLANLQILLLSNNKISIIDNVQFNPLIFLQDLDLSFNQISDFRSVAKAVRQLKMLYNLNMSFNSIAYLQSNQTLLILSSLNILDLRNNSLSVLDLSELYMPNLTSLNVMSNTLNSINGSSFINVPYLSNVTFDKNALNLSVLLQTEISSLTELHWSYMKTALKYDFSVACQVFQSFPRLSKLAIAHSKILASKLHIIGKCTNLTSLILSGTAYRQLVRKELQAFTNLEVLYLDTCKIKCIRNTTWIGLKALHTLSLERNVISYLPDFLFSPLINLRYLDLSKNHLTYINQKAFKNQHKLTHLFLRSCFIFEITSMKFMYLWNLKYLDLQENFILQVKDKAFKKLHRLQTLLLSGNKIHSIQKFAFQGLLSLKTLSLSNNNIYKLSDDILRMLKSLVHLDISRNQWLFCKKHCLRPFKKLKVLESLDISYPVNHYGDSVSETFFEGLDSLQKLYIRGISISFFNNMSFVSLTNLTDLDLSESLQASDQHSISEFIHKFSQLRHLTIDNNNIQDLPEDTFSHLKTLENLSLRNNKLQNISQKLLTPLTNLSYFDAYMNPLSCFCENYWFQNWSQFNTKVQVPLVQSYNCFGQAGSNIKFVNQDLSFCGTDISVFFFLGSFSLTLLFIVTSLVISKLKWSIHYLYYMATSWWQWKLQKEDRIYKYDAYISYCSDDEEWVMNELLFNLECQGKRKYKICFKPRDFIPGVYHIDNIQDAINKSRKTLCVISTSYLESQWCRMEIEMACSKVFYQKEDVLLVVFLENIPNYRLSAYHKLRKLIKQNTYINLPEDPQGHELFWFKLRKALDSGVYEEDTVQLSVDN